MKLAYLLHVYQPPYQSADVLARVVDECYRELFRSLAEAPAGRLVVNMPASLTRQLHEQGFDDVLTWLRRAVRRGRVELTGSAAYHPILPLLPAHQVVRQIRLNERINRELLGPEYQPRGFFCPELCLDPPTASLLRSEGFDWTVMDEIAWSGRLDDYPQGHTWSLGGLAVLLRNRPLSNALAHSVWRRHDVRSADQFAAAVAEERGAAGEALMLATDGEVFGHHQPGRGALLRELLRQSTLEFCSPEELARQLPEEPRELEPCSWSSQPFELAGGLSYSLWRDPSNPLHELQWRLVDQALATARPVEEDAPGPVDFCLASDQFFWASCRPWWDPGMIERGARAVVAALEAAEGVDPGPARVLLDQLVGLATEWEEGGEARRRIRDFAAASALDLSRLGDALQ